MFLLIDIIPGTFPMIQSKATFIIYESLPQIPPELWCSPSAIDKRLWTVISTALRKTTPPIEKAMYEFRCARFINIERPIWPK